MAHALLFQANLPKPFWGDALLTATYLINRTPTPVLKGKTPYEVLFHKPPAYEHLRVFRCLCFASSHHLRPSKFDARSIRCLFLGYPYGTQGYRVYDLETGKTFISHDVIFHEHIFPSITSAATLPTIPTPMISQSPAIDYNDTWPSFERSTTQDHVPSPQAPPILLC